MNEETTQTPEQEAAGNRRALISFGLMTALLLGLSAAGIYAYRMSRGGDGEVCEQKSDCKPGHACVGSLLEVGAQVCRKSCVDNADCESGRCHKLIRKGAKDLTGAEGVCAPK